MRTNFGLWFSRVAGTLLVAGLLLSAAGADEGAGLTPLPIKLPKPMFQGTPKNIKASAHAGEVRREAAGAVHGPGRARPTWPANKKVTSSDWPRSSAS